MSYLFDASYTTTLIEFIKPIGYQGILSKILTATISASILAFSLKKLHKTGFFYVTEEQKPKWKKVGTVDKLLMYPLKGAKGLEQNVAYFGFLGMESEGGLHDRSFVLVDETSHEAIWASRLPKLVLVQMITVDGKIYLKAPGMNDLMVNPKDLEYDTSKEICSKMFDVDIKLILCGKAYDEWFSTFLKGKPTGLKLAFHYSESPQRPARPMFVNKWGFKDNDIPRMAFATPYSLMTWNSLNDLNQRLEKPVSEVNFRPNLVIQADEKTPYIEDQWTKRLRIGDEVILHFAKPCHRCIVTQIDQETGKLIPNGEPMRTLKKYRMVDPNLNGPIFANQFGIDICGRVKVGDLVYAEV